MNHAIFTSLQHHNLLPLNRYLAREFDLDDLIINTGEEHHHLKLLFDSEGGFDVEVIKFCDGTDEHEEELLEIPQDLLFPDLEGLVIGQYMENHPEEESADDIQDFLGCAESGCPACSPDLLPYKQQLALQLVKNMAFYSELLIMDAEAILSDIESYTTPFQINLELDHTAKIVKLYVFMEDISLGDLEDLELVQSMKQELRQFYFDQLPPLFLQVESDQSDVLATSRVLYFLFKYTTLTPYSFSEYLLDTIRLGLDADDKLDYLRPGLKDLNNPHVGDLNISNLLLELTSITSS